jgi:hypothetical protein
MTATPRVLGCAINRSHSSESQTNATKVSKTKLTPSKYPTLPFESIQISTSENCLYVREHVKKPLNKEHEMSSVFRSRQVVDEDDDNDDNELESDLFVLKRANPVFDDEESPTKRLRRAVAFDEDDDRDESCEGQEDFDVLSWSNSLSEGAEGFSFSTIMF